MLAHEGVKIGALNADPRGGPADVAAAALESVGEKLPLDLLDGHVPNPPLQLLELIPGGRQQQRGSGGFELAGRGRHVVWRVRIFVARRRKFSLLDIDVHRRTPKLFFPRNLSDYPSAARAA